MQDSGFIYILSNPSMPGLLKIGKTTGDPRERAKQLQTTGVPAPFFLEFSTFIADGLSTVEEEIHEEMESDRIKNREFFSVSLADAIISVSRVSIAWARTGASIDVVRSSMVLDPWTWEHLIGNMNFPAAIQHTLVMLTPLEIKGLECRAQEEKLSRNTEIECEVSH